MQTAWESEIAGFLTDLTAVQDQTLETLRRKRRHLVALDTQSLAAMAPEEDRLIEQLQQCLQRREQLLARAAQEGLPGENIKSLVKALPQQDGQPLKKSVQSATARMGLLQHESLTNWVLVQRTMLHLAQLLEIIATGGRPQPTYAKGDAAAPSGGLVDRAV
jgi:flagellar biosynthesis/type III secretory pathway chaperone